jgi:Ca2+-binding RTX toxin-like protein
MFCHSLEARVLFAYVPYYISPTPIYQPPVPAMGVSIAGDTLTVNGTNYGDAVTVELTGGTVKVTGTTWSPWGFSTINKTYGVGGLSHFVVEAKGGKDQVTLKGSNGNFNFDDPAFTVRGGNGDDTIDATMAGIALLDGQAGADTFHGTSFTAIDYRSRTGDLFIDRSTAGGDGEAGENDSIGSGIGEIRCGSGDDLILGSTLINHDDRVFGNDGNDTIKGFGGGDMLHGGAGNDSIVGGTGTDWLMGGHGDDLLDASGDPGFFDNVFGDDSSGGPNTGFDTAKKDNGDALTDIDQVI